MFHRLEKYAFNIPEGNYVVVSFETDHRGIWQCTWRETGIDETALTSEPPLHTLKKEEQKEVKEVGPIVFYLTHGEWPDCDSFK